MLVRHDLILQSVGSCQMVFRKGRFDRIHRSKFFFEKRDDSSCLVTKVLQWGRVTDGGKAVQKAVRPSR